MAFVPKPEYDAIFLKMTTPRNGTVSIALNLELPKLI